MKMNNLTKILIAVIVLIAACGKQEQPTGKRAQLDSLKIQKEKISLQQEEIALQIQQLEAELVAAGDTTLGKVEEKMKFVSVAELKAGTFDHFVEIQGKVETENNIMVSSESAGLIKNIYVKRGDKVSEGQVLADIDNTLIKKGIEELKGNLELVTVMYEKQEKLWKENVGTEVQYLQAKNSKESLENKLAQLNEQLKKTKITSPISGVVDEVYKKDGEIMSPGLPAFRVIKATDFKIVGELAESYISKVNVGDEVSVFFPDLNKTLNEKITVVGGSINPTNRTFVVESKLTKSTSDIKPNLVAYLKIKDYSKPKSLVVPINTVQSSRDGKFVYVANGNKAEKKVVKVGETYGSTALVLEGLSEGDKVITFGYNDLTEGQLIKY